MERVSNTSPHLLKGLEPYHTFANRTRQTRKEQCEVCWKEGLIMTGQKLFSTTHRKCCREELVFVRALQGTQPTIWISQLSLAERLRKATHHLSTILGSSRRKVSRKSGGLGAGSFGPSKGRKESTLFNCLATGPESRPEVQAVHPFQVSSWPVFET